MKIKIEDALRFFEILMNRKNYSVYLGPISKNNSCDKRRNAERRMIEQWFKFVQKLTLFFLILFFKLHNNVLSKLRRTLTLLAHLISFFIRFDPI